MLEERINDLLTSTITQVRRINYVRPGGYRELNEGPVEFTLDTGAVFRLESGSDGESVWLCVGEWVDSFAEPLTPENQDFVVRSGKWTAFDVSAEDGYRRIIGQQIGNLSLISASGKVTGVELRFGSMLLRAEVVADELVVDLRDEYPQ